MLSAIEGDSGTQVVNVADVRFAGGLGSKVDVQGLLLTDRLPARSRSGPFSYYIRVFVLYSIVSRFLPCQDQPHHKMYILSGGLASNDGDDITYSSLTMRALQ